MKKNWEIKKLSTVLKIQNGYAFNSKLFTTETGTPLIRIRDIKKGDGTETNFKGEYDKKYEVNAGDLLIGMDGEFGCYEWKGGTALLNQRVCRLQEFNDRIYSRFLFYGINKYLKDIEDVTAFATVKHISSKQIENIEIPLPSFSEQHRIVSILDEAFDAISRAKINAEQNLQNAKELFASYLQGVFATQEVGWEEKTLSDVCEYDKTPNKRNNLPYVGLEDIQSNTGKLIGPLIPRSVKSLTFYFNNKHVLYGRLRPYLNKVLLPDFEGHCSTEVFPIKPKKDVLDRSFLFRWLIAKETMKKINATWTGATLPRANMNTVLEFKINMPPIETQKVIVKNFDALSVETKRLEDIYQQKIADLEELKKSVLQKAFNGELKLQHELSR